MAVSLVILLSPVMAVSLVIPVSPVMGVSLVIPVSPVTVSYTHLTLPTNREV